MPLAGCTLTSITFVWHLLNSLEAVEQFLTGSTEAAEQFLTIEKQHHYEEETQKHHCL